MSVRPGPSSAIALVWAGVAIGGSLIATPAKFQAPSLSLPTALEVGRAQFLWLGIGESVLCCGILVVVFLYGCSGWRFTLPAVLLFAIQRLLVMPFLDANTVEVIAGEASGGGNLHIAYIVLEVAKVLTLLAGGLIGFASVSRR